MYKPLLLIAFLSVLISCDSGINLSQGFWYGEKIDFQLCNNKISEVRIKGITCTGSNVVDGIEVPCYGSFSKLLSHTFNINGSKLDYKESKFEFTLNFSDSSTAIGEYTFRDSCCGVHGELHASLYADKGICNNNNNLYDTTDAVSDTISDSTVNHEVDSFFEDTLNNDVTDAIPDQIVTNHSKAEQALELVNAIRTKVGVSQISLNDAIIKSSSAHALFVVENYDKYQSSGLSIHQENPDWQGFTGKTFIDRMKHFGYSPQGGWEVIAFYANPKDAIAGWMATLYHRIPLIHPNSFETGYGLASGQSLKIDVMDISSSYQTSSKGPSMYPYDKQTNVDTSWQGNEIPQPKLPSGYTYPSGPVVTISFDFSYQYKCHDMLLSDSTNNTIYSAIFTPDSDAYLVTTYSLIPVSPLESQKTYVASIICDEGNQKKTYSWSFTCK